MKMKYASRYFGNVTPNEDKKVKKITVKFSAKDVTGKINVTDIKLEGGELLTGYLINNSEIMKRKRQADNDNAYSIKHYNCLLKGGQNVIIPNRGWLPTHLDFASETLGEWGFTYSFSTYYNTKKVMFGYAVTNTDGIPMLVPFGDPIYRVNLDEDMTGATNGMRFLFTVHENEESSHPC